MYSSFVEERINIAVNDAASEFLSKVRRAIVIAVGHLPSEEENDRGLDVDWYDKEKVEAAIQTFPDVLSTKLEVDSFPIMQKVLAENAEDRFYNLNELAQIPLLVEAGITFDQFDEKERGGLLSCDRTGINVLQNLTSILSCLGSKKGDEGYCKRLENCVLDVMKQLKENKRFTKEDIGDYGLFSWLFGSEMRFFPTKLFRFLLDWDPAGLASRYNISVNEGVTWLPIHWVTRNTEIHGFLSVFEAGLLHYPEKLGFVFHLGQNGRKMRSTAYGRACKKYGEESVRKEILDRFIQHPTTKKDSILLSVAADEEIALDGLYLLLRRDPAAVLRMRGAADNDDGNSCISAPAAVPIAASSINNRGRAKQSSKGKKRNFVEQGAKDNDRSSRSRKKRSRK